MPPCQSVASPFDDWLRETMQLPVQHRQKAFEAWYRAPHARTVHPREGHLIPLLVAAGAASDERSSPIHGQRPIGELAISSFRFGPAEESVA